jgi:hypothetical protein
MANLTTDSLLQTHTADDNFLQFEYHNASIYIRFGFHFLNPPGLEIYTTFGAPTFGENPVSYFFLALSQYYWGRVAFLVRSRKVWTP